METIFDLISKLRTQIEACRTGDNDTQIMDAVTTLNEIDARLMEKSAEGIDFI
jgi:hypothetical protein